MGTDIHSIVQARIKGKWKTVTGDTPDDRSYNTFAVLADVRNGVGFAGVVTGEGWKVLHPPVGLPEDLEIDSDGCVVVPKYVLWPEQSYKKEIEEKWLGDHTHSHLTLTQLQDISNYYADKKYKISGVVDRAEYLKCEAEQRNPESWCGDTWGQGVTIVQKSEVGKVPSYTHVRMQWEVNAMDRLWALEAYIELMEKIAVKHDIKPDDLRLVFGFDS